MKKLILSFRSFIAKGNVIDLAVGVIIGAAFRQIVDSLVNDILSPLIGLSANTQLDALVLTVGDVSIRYGAFLAAVINFLLMAVTLFLIVRVVERIRRLGEHAPAPVPAVCPFCKQEIAADAVRCPHCTSVLPHEEPPAPDPVHA